MVCKHLAEMPSFAFSEGFADVLLDDTYQKLSESRIDQADVDEAMDDLVTGLGVQRRISPIPQNSAKNHLSHPPTVRSLGD